MSDDAPSPNVRGAAVRIAAACLGAAALALGGYLLLSSTRSDDGLVSLSFLLVLPAALSSLLGYALDPWGTAPLWRYMLAPVWLLLAAVVIGAAILGEGVVCIVMLSPLWLAVGSLGAWATFRLRRRLRERGRMFSAAMLATPLLAMQVEPMLPVPQARAVVTRSVVVEASPERLWPLLRGVPDVRADEGRWNISQDVIGVPRPLGARLVGEGVGAVRLARWRHEIRFGEVITRWRPGRAISWRFAFDPHADWGYTDRHLLPSGPLLTVTDGGYRTAPAGPGRTRVTLWTGYTMRTPVNFYARWWGELFLGDLENNLLAIVQGRAESKI